ncbi:MAG: hypothetical protein JAZ17_26385 [Candidatus Thiodiazotropha endolucinida]|nr:hypothetical protein [Candidatus Thiodiazotropha endolucinida]
MSLDWSSFEKLPGDPRINFENLCRGITRSHWAQYGQFIALKNQPGVEFHLNLTQNCPALGDTSRWYGWQCKKFDLTKTASLTAASKKQVTDSLDKTVKHLPDLTDWVLWTPYTLSKPDQEWFKSLDTKYPYSLHMWTDEEIENLLAGPALLLKETYFGELVLTPEELQKRHEEAIEPIKERWISPVHQKTDVERIIRRMLGEPSYWGEMIEIGEDLSKAANEIEEWDYKDPNLEDASKVFLVACKSFSEMLTQFHAILSEGDIDVIRQWLKDRKSLVDYEVKSFLRSLRKKNIPVSLIATNAFDDLRIAQNLFDEIEDYLDIGMVAVLADAGGGKTHMAAALSSQQDNRPAGILLHGRNLKRGNNHDDLASQFVLHGSRLDSMEKLLSCLDSAGKRAGCILPLIIDGLNEAENPKEWKDILSHIQLAVKGYPNVLVICTLRTGEHKRPYWPDPEAETRESFAVQALPDNIWVEECEGFGEDLMDAIHKYFEFYKIDCEKGVEVPGGFLNHPLNMRIFCDVTNPKRERTVEINYFPASLTHLFNKYLENACNRISGMKNLSYNSQELKDAIYRLGISLWEAKDREICDQTYRDAIGDSTRDWNESIVNLFAQEGIIFRNPGTEPGKYVVTPVYDALGGHIIASALLKQNSKNRNFGWLNESTVISAFSGDQTHSLAHDIFKSLVALVPSQMYGEQLWRNVSDKYKQKALLYAADLNPEHIDEDTANALAELIIEKSDKVRKIFSRLWLTKGALKHPLNANFLNSTLLNMSVAERDLSWTEWVRSEKDRGKDRVTPELINLEAKWKSDLSKRTESDRLRVKAIKWLLTSTDYPLRDAATRALYWFGRGDPEFLFDETIQSLEINDPYVSERMLAASYGVSMSLSVQLSNSSIFTNGVLSKFAGLIFEAIFKENAQHYTTHQFIRDFASRIIELAQYHNPTFFTDKDIEKTQPPYSKDKSPQWGERYIDADLDGRDRFAKFLKKLIGQRLYNKARELIPKKLKEEAIDRRIERKRQSPFLMDFENYTIGGLVPNRSNYNYEHGEYQKVRAKLQWRVEELGWAHKKFKDVEEAIQRWQGYERISNDKLKTDRYGKKYSWIAYFEMYGLLKDKGILDDNYDWWRSKAQNIDPSFLPQIVSKKLLDEKFYGSADVETADWIREGDFPNIDAYLKVSELEGQEGPWIALDGYVNQENKDLKRATFFFLRSFLVQKKDKDEILDYSKKQSLGGRWLPEKLEFSQTFFAEMPWSSAFPNEDYCDLSFVVGEEVVIRQRPRVEVRNTDEGIEIIKHNEMEEYEEMQETYKTFKAIMPACDLRQDVANGESARVPALTKKIAIEMNLIDQPQSFDMHTKEGEAVTCFFSHKEEGHKNRHSMYYCREDLLQAFMEKDDLCMIWAIWGERNYSFAWPDRPDDSLPEPRYADFGIVKEYTS